MAVNLEEPDRLPFTIFTYLVNVSRLLPNILRVVSGRSAESARAAAPTLLAAVRAIETSSLSVPGTNIGTGAVHMWNLYRGVRIKLHHCVVLLVVFAQTSMVQSCPRRLLQEQRNICLQAINADVQSVFDTIEHRTLPGTGDDSPPAIFPPPCWIDSLRNLWPLSVICRLMTIPAHQREAAVCLLRKIRGELGFGGAVQCHMRPVILPTEVRKALERDNVLEYLLTE